MVLRSLATATLLLGVLGAGCGRGNPAAKLSDCLMDGAQKLASSGTESQSVECKVHVKGPYKLMFFPPRQVMDTSAHQQAESTLFAAAKIQSPPIPTHESIWIVPDENQGKLSYRKSFVQASQIFTLHKTDGHLTAVLRKTGTGIEVADLQ
jgi:hypothetical protein